MTFVITPTNLLGVVVLFYLSSFVFFAIVRILTGVSIRRLGYFSIRGIVYSKNGVQIEVSRLGFTLHRPTYAQPTWISLVVRDTVVTLDPKTKPPPPANEPPTDPTNLAKVNPRRRKGSVGQLWQHATPQIGKYVSREDMESFEVQEVIRRQKWLDLMEKGRNFQRKLFRSLHWIKMSDVILLNTIIVFKNVGKVEFGLVTVTVDTRRKEKEQVEGNTACSESTSEQHPFEFSLSCRKGLITSEGRRPVPFMENGNVNISGMLDKRTELLKDVAISTKFGKINIPIHEIEHFTSMYNRVAKPPGPLRHKKRDSLSSVMEEMSLPGSRTERLVEQVMESKEILTSILSAVSEIQVAVAAFEISNVSKAIRPSGKPLLMTATLKELGLDIHQMDSRSPAHRMDFGSDDVAHQALLAAISLSLSVNDGQGHVDKILYIPMATITSKTTLPSKTIQLAEKAEADRNANILMANTVITSPSLDLEPRHLPMLLALFGEPSSRPKHRHGGMSQPQQLISRLLPKVNLKVTIHEPVIRILLPSQDPQKSCSREMDMLISLASTLSVDLESSHSAEIKNHYTLTSTVRLTTQKLFYRAASGEKNDLLRLDTIDFKLQLDALPQVRIGGHCYFETFAVRLVRPEIIQGIKQMISSFHKDVLPDKMYHGELPKQPNLLRRLPIWLVQFKIEGKDFSVEVAGVDEEISSQTRGAAIQIEHWMMDYKLQEEEVQVRTHPRRKASRVLGMDDRLPLTSARQNSNSTDGKCLILNINGFETFLVDNLDAWEPDPICSVPQFEIKLLTLTDKDGITLNISCHTKYFFIHYSLFSHYALLVAAKILRDTFKSSRQKTTPKTPNAAKVAQFLSPIGNYGKIDVAAEPDDQVEFINIDFKIKHLKVKAKLPHDPKMMLEIYHFEAGQERHSFPFVKARNFRLYIDSPTSKQSWARVVSALHFRADFRETKHKTGKSIITRKSFDVTMDALRLAVPHQMVFYNVTDNVTNTLKASQQLHHRFKTGTNEYILDKHAEGPKHMPRVSIRTKAMQFELEDDPFEFKLAMIHRMGLSEQKNRLAREDAFRAKVIKLNEAKNPRNSSATNRSLERDPSDGHLKKRQDSMEEEPPLSPKTKKRMPMRYDVENAQGPSSHATVSVDEAWQKLQEHNSLVWIKRMKWLYPIAQKKIEVMRRKFMGGDEPPKDIEFHESILHLPPRPALMIVSITDLDLLLDKPSFQMSELPNFMHRVGKGLPKDTLFSLLIPMNIKLNMGEVRINLRDYPLPLLHVPQMRSLQSNKGPAFQLCTDFVIAEELRDHESMRHVRVDIVPKEYKDDVAIPGFAIDVRRTVSPVKSYSDIDIMVNTSYATRITWGTSYQPAIQDMMMVIETFTKPHSDPSEKIGFWDKLRLSMHTKIRWTWKGDGDVHLTLKGSRDPYIVTGDGAGFVMCWRGNVQWKIAYDDNPLNFVVVQSEEYLLAIPDFTNEQSRAISHHESDDDSQSMSSGSSYKSGALFKKVIMKLAGKVRWQVGLMFEQETDKNEDWTKRNRSFEFIPHYEITLKSPEFAKGKDGQEYDAFRGFRSHFIHMSLSIIAPLDHDFRNAKASQSYNAMHLTPRFFTHFYSWWGLFSGVMSLPIRQGPLWPGIEKSSKKFGRHLATIKYKLLLSPLFISHVYKHKDAEEYNTESKFGNDTVTATGLKVRLDSFTFDVHQRREESVIKVKGFNIDRKSSNMSINQAEVDFHSADIRAVSAMIAGTTVDDLKDWAGGDNEKISPSHAAPLGDTTNFNISDGDLSWIDMDDFVELDWILPTRSSPETKIMPLAYAPRFTYLRQTDHSLKNSIGKRARSSPFGHEPTHECVMLSNTDPREIQCDIIQSRLEKVNLQMKKNKEALQALAQEIVFKPEDEKLKKESEKLIDQSSALHNKILILQNMLKRMSERPEDMSAIDDDSESEVESILLDSVPYADFVNDFNNRFLVHNMQLKWNNSLRNIILRYIHQVNQRRGFVYYMSRRAVKFILDLVEEQKLEKEKRKGDSPVTEDFSSVSSRSINPSAEEVQDESVAARIQALVEDVHKHVLADDKGPRHRRMSEGVSHSFTNDLVKGISDEYVPLNSYHVRLIAPQIQFQSEKNPKSALLVTSQGMQLKVISVMDKDRMEDDVSGLVQRRFALDLENAQAFVSRQKDFSMQVHSLHSANKYGCQAGIYWPPWVPLENMFDFSAKPHGFSRVVQKTSTTFRFDKHNSLRLKLIDTGLDAGGVESSPLEAESRIDHVWATFQKVEVSCNSIEYFSLYIIVLDLLLYTEPLEKSRNERLEKIMLASDFSDLSGAPDLVSSLQSRIHQMEEIKAHFQLNSKYLDKKGWEDRLDLERDLVTCEDELFFLMKSIMSVQRKFDERQQTTGMVRWFLSATEIVAHLLRGKNQPFVDLKLENASYERTDNSDGSNYNTLEVEMLKGLNRLPDAIYPTMLAPFLDSTHDTNKAHQTKILRIYWYMLEAIAGIPVMDHFEVNLFPLQIQLDRDVGEKLFEYIFPGMDSNATENGGFSPFMVQTANKPLPDKTPDDSDGSDDTDIVSQDVSVTDSSTDLRKEVSMPLHNRLQPTMHANSKRPVSQPERLRPKTQHSDWQFRGLRPRTATTKQKSYQDLSMAAKKGKDATVKQSFESSRRSLDMPPPPTPKLNGESNAVNGSAEPAKVKQLFHRNGNSGQHGKEKPDEISQMISRASNYMTLAYIKIPSVVLCLSYKGKGERNIEDIHEFVFRLPTLEYRNKMWSNLDLALRMKKDVIKALISHTGAILENKILHHRPHQPRNHHLRHLVTGAAQSAASNIFFDDSDASSNADTSDATTPMLLTPRTSAVRLNSAGPSSTNLARQNTSASHISTRSSSGSSSLFIGTNGNSLDNDSFIGPLKDMELDGDDKTHGFLHNALGRHLSLLSNDRRAREGIAGDTEESMRKKSRLLLGKKLSGA